MFHVFHLLDVVFMQCEYVYFDVYARANGQDIDLRGSKKGEVKQGQMIVLLKIVEGLDNKCHIVAMDNLFTSIELFQTLYAKGIHSTCTIRTNRVGLPKAITNTKQFGKRQYAH